jgi:hypothetical protein
MSYSWSEVRFPNQIRSILFKIKISLAQTYVRIWSNALYIEYYVYPITYLHTYTAKKRSGWCNIDENRTEQCFAAHIVHSCQQYWTILLHPIQAQQHCSTLLTSVNNVGSKTLFSPVEQGARRFLPCSLHGKKTRHTSKPGPDSDSDPDSDSKKIRTREKPGPGLEQNPDSYLTKPGLDFWKPGLEIDKTGFKTRTLCTRMQRFFGKV